jgi:hypothetical protein
MLRRQEQMAWSSKSHLEERLRACHLVYRKDSPGQAG